MDTIVRISYPPVHPGTDATGIVFAETAPDFIDLFKPGEKTGRRRFFVTDAKVATLALFAPFIARFDDGICGDDRLAILGSGEGYKTIESVLTIVKNAIDAEFSRKDSFVAVGGGVISDITGFAASLFKRGASCAFVPTTLLSMVDAAIGGKTGCDFNNYKNMIGSFYPAESIYIFPEFVQSLSEDQYRSGLAEALKTALLYDAELYDVFKNESEKICSRDKATVNFIIKKCAVAKASVVERDFTEQNIRTYLNYGHTFGHALESLAGFGSVTHGDAVAWGISRAVTLSCNIGLCSRAYKDEVLSVLERYGWETDPVPSIIKGGAAGARLLSIMHKDKKNIGGGIRLVLQKGLTETVSETVGDDVILNVLK
ncbi:MAG: 3-dehydroquinate synthase family protein [Treponema socranskii subsp. buccale]